MTFRDDVLRRFTLQLGWVRCRTNVEQAWLGPTEASRLVGVQPPGERSDRSGFRLQPWRTQPQDHIVAFFDMIRTPSGSWSSQMIGSGVPGPSSRMSRTGSFSAAAGCGVRCRRRGRARSANTGSCAAVRQAAATPRSIRTSLGPDGWCSIPAGRPGRAATCRASLYAPVTMPTRAQAAVPPTQTSEHWAAIRNLKSWG